MQLHPYGSKQNTYIHTKISERKQADKRITTSILVLLKFRLELWPMWTYFRNSNDCFIKSQTVGKSWNWGFRIYWICVLGWSVLKLVITLWKASIKLYLNILFELQCRKKWCSLSITLQLSHNLCSFGIFLYLPISILKLIAYAKICEKLFIFKAGFFQQIFFQFYWSFQLTIQKEFRIIVHIWKLL